MRPPEGEASTPPPPQELDAEIGITKHTAQTSDSGANTNTKGYSRLGKDLIWSNIGLKLVDKNGDTKLNILKVS